MDAFFFPRLLADALRLKKTVLFKFRQDATAELKETFVRELKQLRHLPSVLNQSLVVGGPSVTDSIERSKGYHYALVSYHKDKAALEAYQASSEHHRQVSSTTITSVKTVVLTGCSSCN